MDGMGWGGRGHGIKSGCPSGSSPGRWCLQRVLERSGGHRALGRSDWAAVDGSGLAVEAPTSACPRDAGAANERERVERGAAQRPGRGRSLVAEVGTGGDWQSAWRCRWMGAWRCRWMGAWRCRWMGGEPGARAAASVGAPNGTDRRRSASDRRGSGCAPALACERAAGFFFLGEAVRVSVGTM